MRHRRWSSSHRCSVSQSGCASLAWNSCWGRHWTQSVTRGLKSFRGTGRVDRRVGFRRVSSGCRDDAQQQSELHRKYDACSDVLYIQRGCPGVYCRMSQVAYSENRNVGLPHLFQLCTLAVIAVNIDSSHTLPRWSFLTRSWGYCCRSS